MQKQSSQSGEGAELCEHESLHDWVRSRWQRSRRVQWTYCGISNGNEISHCLVNMRHGLDDGSFCQLCGAA